MLIKRILFACFFILLLTTFVLANQMNTSDFENLEEQNFSIDQINLFGCEMLKSYENDLKQFEIPKKIPFKNEIFHLYIENTFFGEMIIHQGYIDKINCDINEKKTYEISISNYSVLFELIENMDIAKIKENLAAKEIEVVGFGIDKKIKWFFSKIVIRWFI